jgi:antitoxin component of MazEF toxin-antitoxin module
MKNTNILISAIVKKIGGSMSILIPKYFVEEFNIKEGDRVEVLINKVRVYKVTREVKDDTE